MNPQSLLPEKKWVGKSCLKVLQVGQCLNPQLSEVRAGLRRVQWGDGLKFIAQGCGCNFF